MAAVFGFIWMTHYYDYKKSENRLRPDFPELSLENELGFFINKGADQ